MRERIHFRCTARDFVPQEACRLREVTADEWRRSRKVWGIYSEWGPQDGDIEKLERKGFSLFVFFEQEKAMACAVRLNRTDDEDEIDSVWVAPDRRGAGVGRRTVGSVTQAILKDGKVALYRTRPDNVASIRVAESVGFRRFTPTVS